MQVGTPTPSVSPPRTGGEIKPMRGVGLLLLVIMSLLSCQLPNTSQTGNSGDNNVTINIYLDGKLLGQLKDLIDDKEPKPSPSASSSPSASPTPSLCEQEFKIALHDQGIGQGIGHIQGKGHFFHCQENSATPTRVGLEPTPTATALPQELEECPPNQEHPQGKNQDVGACPRACPKHDKECHSKKDKQDKSEQKDHGKNK